MIGFSLDLALGGRAASIATSAQFDVVGAFGLSLALQLLKILV
jgi:hypothetical protein